MQSEHLTDLSPEDLAEAARARAAFCAFLNIHFTTLPDRGFVERIRSQEFTSVLEALAGNPDVDEDLSAGAFAMLSFIQTNAETEAGSLSDTLGVDRTRLYRGVSPVYGPPPPYEAVWAKGVTNTAAALQVIAAVYRQNGVSVAPEATDRQDYVGIELDFVRILAGREGEAWNTGDEAAARALLAEQASFMTQHLGAWAPDFIGKALELAETDFYRGHLRMLRGFLAAESERLQAAAGTPPSG